MKEMHENLINNIELTLVYLKYIRKYKIEIEILLF